MENKKASTLLIWEGLLLGSILLFFVDAFLLFGAFYVTIPLVVTSAIVANVYAAREKKYGYILGNALLALVPIAAFLLIPW